MHCTTIFDYLHSLLQYICAYRPIIGYKSIFLFTEEDRYRDDRYAPRRDAERYREPEPSYRGAPKDDYRDYREEKHFRPEPRHDDLHYRTKEEHYRKEPGPRGRSRGESSDYYGGEDARAYRYNM